MNKKIAAAAMATAMMAAMAVPAMADVTTSTSGETAQDVVVNVQINPTITMSLSTNEINFLNADPTTASYEQPNAIDITIQSNNVYKLTVKAADDFKTVGETPLVMTVDHLKARVDDVTYLAMSKDAAVVLIENEPNTDSKLYQVDFRLDSDWQVKPGAYSTTLNFVASQL